MRGEAMNMVAAVGLLLAGCGDGGDAPAAPANAAEAPANATAPAGNVAAEAHAAQPAAPTLSLAGNGLLPGLTFGMPRAAAVEAARAAFGAPTGEEHADECGGGPMDLVSFHDLQLVIEDGRFTGWMLGGAQPALRSAGGLAIGAPRSVLGNAEVDEESGLGPEFSVDDVGGILDQTGTRIEALWAGSVCQFG